MISIKVCRDQSNIPGSAWQARWQSSALMSWPSKVRRGLYSANVTRWFVRHPCSTFATQTIGTQWSLYPYRTKTHGSTASCVSNSLKLIGPVCLDIMNLCPAFRTSWAVQLKGLSKVSKSSHCNFAVHFWRFSSVLGTSVEPCNVKVFRNFRNRVRVNETINLAIELRVTMKLAFPCRTRYGPQNSLSESTKRVYFLIRYFRNWTYMCVTRYRDYNGVVRQMEGFRISSFGQQIFPEFWGIKHTL